VIGRGGTGGMPLGKVGSCGAVGTGGSGNPVGNGGNANPASGSPRGANDGHTTPWAASRNSAWRTTFHLSWPGALS
jgi:hypothetical protein